MTQSPYRQEAIVGFGAAKSARTNSVMAAGNPVLLRPQAVVNGGRGKGASPVLSKNGWGAVFAVCFNNETTKS